jgi:DNA-binding response OmpR family regulator
MLESKGILCDIIDNSEDSMKYRQKQKYDLVLMDVHLPG